MAIKPQAATGRSTVQKSHASTLAAIQERIATLLNTAGTTGGAGFGNKTSSGGSLDNSDIRFGSASHTGPYSAGTEYGSGTTGGAG